MSVDDRLNKIIVVQNDLNDKMQAMQQMHERFGSRDGGGSGPVDDRVSRLEGRVDKVIDELGGVKVNIATLTERVSHLPSKGFIVTTTTAALALVAAIAVFADNIKAALG